MPATNGARIRRVHSSSVNASFDVMRTSFPHCEDQRGDLSGRGLHGRRTRAAAPALHEPRPAGVRGRRAAGDDEGCSVRALLALPGHVAPAVPRRVRGRRRRAGGCRERAGGGAAGPRVRRLRRRLGRAARRGAHRLRVRLERRDEGARASAARGLPRAEHPLHRLRRAGAGTRATGTTATRSSGPPTSGRWTACSRPTRRCSRAWRRGSRRASHATPPIHRARTPAPCAPRRSTSCAACCPRLRCRTSASSPRARRTSS